MPFSILLVEDDMGIADVIGEALPKHDFDLRWCRSAEAALPLIREYRYDCILLDLMLPDQDGFHFCRDVKALSPATPVIMLTARDSLDDKLKGFESGADDYLTKPFAPAELIARLHVLLRRNTHNNPKTIIEYGDIRIDDSAREVFIHRSNVDLTKREFDLLRYLIAHKHAVIPREQLLMAVWPDDLVITLNTVDVYISYLRKKLTYHQSDVRIMTVRGIGFKLD